jgi:hypothetical protein
MRISSIMICPAQCLDDIHMHIYFYDSLYQIKNYTHVCLFHTLLVHSSYCEFK